MSEPCPEVEASTPRASLRAAQPGPGPSGDSSGDGSPGAGGPRDEATAVSSFTPEVPLGWQAPLLDLLLAMGRSAGLIATLLVLGLAVGIVLALVRPPYYRSSAAAALMPREKPVLDATIRTSSVATSDNRAQRRETGNLMLPGRSELYLAILRSRPVLEAIRLRFRNRMGWSLVDGEVDQELQSLQRAIKLEASEDGLLTLIVTAHEPVVAADMANALLEEGQKASEAIERQLLLQQAQHLGKVLASRRQALIVAEDRLNALCRENRVVNLETRATQDLVLLKETSARRDRYTNDLAELLHSYTEQDPRVVKLRARVAACDEHLKAIRARAGGPGEARFGGLANRYQALSEEVRLARDAVSALTFQEELFRMRAEQPSGNMAVIRRATVVYGAAGPQRKRTLVVCVALALIAGVGCALLREQWRRARQDPHLAGQLRALRELLPGTRRS